MKKLTIRIRRESDAALKELGERFIRAWKTGKSAGDTLQFESPAALFRVLSPKRWELIEQLQRMGPSTIRGLGRELKRDIKRVHDDVRGLLDCKLVARMEDGKIHVPYGVIHADFDLRAVAWSTNSPLDDGVGRQIWGVRTSRATQLCLLMPSEFNRFLSIAPALEAAGAEHMSEDEIVAEVKATRAEHVLPLARRRIRRRMVLDTKMVISALLWCGTPYRLLTRLRAPSDHQLFSSTVLLAELAEVLTRTSVSKRLALIKQTAQSVLADYAAAVTLAETLSVPQIVPTDPDDDHVLACALPAQADLTVSGDSDLLTLSRYHEIPILLPSHPIASAEELQCP